MHDRDGSIEDLAAEGARRLPRRMEERRGGKKEHPDSIYIANAPTLRPASGGEASESTNVKPLWRRGVV